MPIKFTDMLEAKAPRKVIKDKNVWNYAVKTAIANIEQSIEDWDNRKEAVNPAEFKSKCWRPKSYKDGSYLLSLKVGTKKITIDPDKKLKDPPFPEKAVKANLESMLSYVQNISKGEDETAIEMYEAGKAAKLPKGYKEGITRKMTDGSTQTLTFSNDEWNWV